MPHKGLQLKFYITNKYFIINPCFVNSVCPWRLVSLFLHVHFDVFHFIVCFLITLWFLQCRAPMCPTNPAEPHPFMFCSMYICTLHYAIVSARKVPTAVLQGSVNYMVVMHCKNRNTFKKLIMQRKKSKSLRQNKVKKR